MKNSIQRCLYLDMDDVVADWNKEAMRHLQRTWVIGDRLPDEEWRKLQNHSRFYRNLPLMPGAEELVAWARDYTKRNNMHLAFLTAIPQSNEVPYAIYDKLLWAQERFPHIPVFFGPYSQDKHMHCQPGDILIDDRVQNCLDWRAVGGIAHQYSTWENCRSWIYHNLDPTIK